MRFENYNFSADNKIDLLVFWGLSKNAGPKVDAVARVSAGKHDNSREPKSGVEKSLLGPEWFNCAARGPVPVPVPVWYRTCRCEGYGSTQMTASASDQEEGRIFQHVRPRMLIG